MHENRDRTWVKTVALVAVMAAGPAGFVLGAGADVRASSRPAGERAEGFPPGHVRGDVVSYSYVPIRTWSPSEGTGILPYLFEYALMTLDGRKPLEAFHAENIRRIDIASQWSTAIELYNRRVSYRDEIINLMIRCHRNRQLIILWGRPSAGKNDDKDASRSLTEVLDKLWADRDRELVSPEGDRATGRQLINNILAVSLGDEGECGLGTHGLEKLFADFDRNVRLREMDGQRPFSHIKGWYNMLSYAALDYNGCYAASQTDMDEHKRVKLPPNTQAIGVDAYHYWGHKHSPFDPADLSIPRAKVRAHSDEWQRLRTRYYPEGLQVRVCKGSADPDTWVPECWNDTHALMSAIELAGAKNAMMWYIAACGQIEGQSYTTPIETMESYYEHLKAGPWVGLSWWTFGGFQEGGEHGAHFIGGLEYYDRVLKHYTPQHPEGEPYSAEMLDYWRREYVALKMRMFNDVVYNQFGHLNGPRPATENKE
jgi:hypothetical protein